ncbi:hypothetical protein [Methylocystis heyeri]|uniref:Uncharacterized protein n=1 Tax=Methylocystis heyeri TaxID=391905 RepID=A0A6B8KGC0_9HYPH|nr:hypothetical protein [Methylocystis heyeri]QGM45598.1 hypothetical protein H2LOC_007740 [Methylocystis heyeri]
MSSWNRLPALSLSAVLLLGAFAAAPAQAAKLGPYFPLPNNFPLGGNSGRDDLLKIQARWLENGLENLEKAKKETTAALDKAKGENAKPEQIAALEQKQTSLDSDIEATKKEIALENDDMAPKEQQADRKRQFLLNVNQWIQEIGRQATQALKDSILKDGAEAEIAQNRHDQLENLADRLERAKRDQSVENWGVTR